MQTRQNGEFAVLSHGEARRRVFGFSFIVNCRIINVRIFKLSENGLELSENLQAAGCVVGNALQAVDKSARCSASTTLSTTSPPPDVSIKSDVNHGQASPA